MNEHLDKTMKFLKDLPVIGQIFNPAPKVATIRFSGVIADTPVKKQGISHHRFARPIEKAFGKSNLKAVALIINSPGGSPVQSHLIFQRIRELAKEHDLPVIAFIEDPDGYKIELVERADDDDRNGDDAQPKCREQDQAGDTAAVTRAIDDVLIGGVRRRPLEELRGEVASKEDDIRVPRACLHLLEGLQRSIGRRFAPILVPDEVDRGPATARHLHRAETHQRLPADVRIVLEGTIGLHGIVRKVPVACDPLREDEAHEVARDLAYNLPKAAYGL